MISQDPNHKRHSYISRANTRACRESDLGDLSTEFCVKPDAVKPAPAPKSALNRDRILDAWARGDAAKSIAASEGAATAKVILGIIGRARDAADPRAVLRKPGTKGNCRPMPKPPQEALTRRRALSDELGIHSRTVFTPVLRIPSQNCAPIPISIPCLRNEATN